MNRDDAVTEIQRGLGFRSDLEAECILALKEAQRHFEHQPILPWFLISEDASIAVSDGVRTTALPSSFIREVDGEGPHFTVAATGGIIYLPKLDFGYANALYATTDEGKPIAYALRGTSFYWFPEPDDDYTLTHSFYAEDTVLDTNIENSWLQYVPNLLIARAGASLAADIQNAAAVQKFTALLQEAEKDLLAMEIEREAENRPYYMGAKV